MCSIPHTTARPRTHSDTLPPAPHDDAPIPAHDDGAEMCVIGSEILDPDCIDGVNKILPPSAFHGMMPRTIQGVIMTLKAKGIPVDGVTILAQLKEQGFAGISDAFDYMKRAVDDLPSAENVEAYTQTVYDRWQDRQIESILHEAIEGTRMGATRESTISTLTAKLARLAPSDKAEKQWPVMGDRAYYGAAGELVRLVGPHTEADPVAILIQFIVAFGSAAGRNVYFQIGASRHYMNLFVCLMGATNAGRKGTSLDPALLPIRLLDHDWADDCQASGLSSGEGLIHAVRDARFQDGELVDEGVANKTLLVIETELAAPVQRMGKEGNSLSTLLRQAWDCVHALRTMTKGSPLRATAAYISLLAHVTPDELLKLLTATDQTNGFANRFLWYLVKRSKYLPFGGRIDEALLAPILDRLREALAFSKEPREIIMSQSAAEAWEPEYRRLTQDAPGIAGAMTARGAPIVRRLACIYACLDCSDKVELPHLQAALALWDYCRESVEYVFGDAGAKKESAEDRDCRELLEILELNDGHITMRDLRAKKAKYRRAGEAEAAAEKLIARGLARWDEEITAGRSATVLCLAVSQYHVSEAPKIKENKACDTDTVIPPSINVSVSPPDDDRPPVAYLEAEAAAEIARQAQAEEVF